jgi:predicted dehydrogenase
MPHVWRVGVLGLGHWYSAYGLGRTLPEYGKARLVAAAWHDLEQLDEFCTTFGVESEDDYEAVLRRDDVDIVHLAAPVSEMSDLAIRAARAGKHIILGKPMAMNVEGADRIVEAVEEAGVVCVPFQSIMRLRYKRMRERIASGEVGDVVVMHTTARWSIAEDWYNSGSPGWFVDPAHVPGGALIDEGIYWVDLMQWLAGSPIVEVDGRVANLVHKDIDVEDWGHATFLFENGIIATMEGAWTITAPLPTAPSPKQNSVVRLEIVGKRGEMIDQWFRDPGLSVLRAGAADWTIERSSSPPFVPDAPMPLAHLIECLETGSNPIGTVAEARDAFVATMAAYEAARAGRPVRLKR